MTPRRIALFLIAGILFILLVLLILPNHQRFVVDDMSKPQTFTFKRYGLMGPTGIDLKIKGEVKNGAANIRLGQCGSPFPVRMEQYVGKVNATLAGDYFQNEACINYTPIHSPKGSLEFTVSIN